MIVPLTPAQQRQAEEYWPEAVRIAKIRCKKWSHTLPSFDEFVSDVATSALLASVRKYDPSRGVLFRTLLGNNIATTAIDEMRTLTNYRRKGYVTPFQGGVRHRLTPDGPYVDCLAIVEADEEPIGDEMEYEDLIKGLARRLRQPHRDAFLVFYLEASGRLMRETASLLGTKEANVSLSLKYAHEALRRNPRSLIPRKDTLCFERSGRRSDSTSACSSTTTTACCSAS